MKRTRIYCVTTPENCEWLVNLAKANGYNEVLTYFENEHIAVVNTNGGIASIKYEVDDNDYTKVTPEEFEQVIVSKPVYLTAEQWQMVIKATDGSLPNIAKSIQSQLNNNQ